MKKEKRRGRRRGESKELGNQEDSVGIENGEGNRKRR